MIVAAAARHEHQKGLDVLVEALAAVRRAHPDAQLVVAGREGVTTDLLRATAAHDGTTAAVHLLGARTDVPDLVAAADVFVARSRWEGLGSAVVEAMGIGTPIVASDVAAIRPTRAASASRCSCRPTGPTSWAPRSSRPSTTPAPRGHGPIAGWPASPTATRSSASPTT